MSRVTVKHVRQMSEHVSKNMRKVGLLRDNQVLVLVEAEKMNGIPYRLHTATDGTGGYGDTGLLPGGNGFLGWTAREALRVLEVVNAVLITQHNREKMWALKTISAVSTQMQED